MIHQESWCKELTSSKKGILRYLKGPVNFEKLPPEYQMSIRQYTSEGLSEEEFVDHIPNYKFLYGEVPTEVLVKEIERVHKAEIGDSFDSYHQWYLGQGYIPDHGPENRWPVTLSEYYEEEVLEDGWHRLHDYYRKGHKTIPVVEWVHKGKKK